MCSTPSGGQLGVPDDLWRVVLEQADELGVLMMGLTAYDEGHLDRAKTAWSGALQSGSAKARANAAINLAQLRRDEAGQARSAPEALERLQPAYQLLVRAWELRDPDQGPRAARILGQVMTELGILQQTPDAARRACSNTPVTSTTWRRPRSILMRPFGRPGCRACCSLNGWASPMRPGNCCARPQSQATTTWLHGPLSTSVVSSS